MLSFSATNAQMPMKNTRASQVGLAITPLLPTQLSLPPRSKFQFPRWNLHAVSGPVAALRTHFPRRPVLSALRPQNAPAALLELRRGLPKENLRFSPRCLTDLASIARDFATMRTLAVIFVLALIAIDGGICSDPVMMSGRAPHTGPDPVTLAVAHAVKSRPESRP